MPWKNKEEERAYRKVYRKAHKEELDAYGAVYREQRRKELSAYAKQYRKDNPEETQAYNERRRNDEFLHQRSRYGVDGEKFLALRVVQDDQCAICGKLFVETPHIDHDHGCCGPKKACEKCRRGLLCRQCNAGIGNLQDSIEILLRAVDYLRKYEMRKMREILDGEANDARNI
jgi:hypothetical protein